jgi:hypothetical protein
MTGLGIGPPGMTVQVARDISVITFSVVRVPTVLDSQGVWNSLIGSLVD